MPAENQRPIREGIIRFPSPGEAASLLGNKCASCQAIFFPKRAICPNCFTDDTLTEFVFGRTGKIYSFTIVYYPSPSGISAPYAYGYVDLPENNMRVFSLFTESDPAKLNVGMDVELVIDKVRTDRDGVEVIGYKFKPVERC